MVCVVIFTGLNHKLSAQIYRMGAGLCFTSGFQYNSADVGNPGFKAKTWVALDRRSTMHIVPTITVFNRSVRNAGTYTITNNMYMGDVDGQFVVFHEGTLKIVVFGGGNISYLTSEIAQVDKKYPIPDYAPEDQDDLVFGGNIGAGLELRMASHWDMNLSGKYLMSKYSQFVISIEGVYYFKSRRRAYRR